MDEELYVKRPEDVKEVLHVMKEEFFELMGLDTEDEDVSFRIHMIPAFLYGSGSFEVINGFNLILEGACALPAFEGRNTKRVSVIELVADEGNVKGHSYIVTPLNFVGTYSNVGKGYYSYFFVRPATSGYSGTGPEIQRLIQSSIDSKIPIVRQRVANIKSSKSLNGLFYERGPIVNISFPDFLIGLGPFEYDDRFKE